MKYTICVLFAILIGCGAYATNKSVKSPINKVIKTTINFWKYPVTGTCSNGSSVTIYSDCTGTVAQCSPGWNEAIEAACD